MKKTKSILVVDDELEISSAVKRVLEKENYQVYLAGSVNECREFLKSKRPDLILMDVVLQDGNGIELAKELNQDQDTNSIGILLMSGLKTEEIDRQMGLGVGALDFVTKPLQMNNLVQRIKLIFSVQQLESRRIELEIRHEQLFSNVSDLVFVLDHSGKIQNLSKSFERITEFNLKDWLNKPFEELIFEKDREILNQHIQKVLNDQLQEVFEISMMKNSQSLIPVSLVLSKIQKDNRNEAGILGILKDQSLNKFFESESSKKDDRGEEQRTREKFSWEAMSASSTSLTQNAYEVSAFSNQNSEQYKKLVDEYSLMIEKSIESRIYRIDHDNSGDRREFSGRLGFFKAGPRDLIRINSEFFRQLDANIHPKKLSLYHEEARLVLLEIMGYLVSFYRNRNIN